LLPQKKIPKKSKISRSDQLADLYKPTTENKLLNSLILVITRILKLK
jgi:hypothetical protein